MHGLVHEPGDVATLTAQLDLLDADRATLAPAARRRAMAHAPELSWAAAAQSLVAAYGRRPPAVPDEELRADAA